MRLKILYDNKVQRPGLQGAWGFSCLIGEEVLFDTGGDPEILLSNIEGMGADITKITDVVISHDHWDHTGGIDTVLKGRSGVKVHICPDFGIEFREKVLSFGGDIVEHEDLFDIKEGISVTGTVRGKYKEKDIEEQGLVIRTPGGVTLMTGCAHPGVVNIAEKAKIKAETAKMKLVLGGFHLGNVSPEEIVRTAENLRSMGFSSAGPCHCSGDEAIAIFKKIFAEGFTSVSAGTEFEA
ncbi:MAG: MBL fold metallo-hydrolase [Candidatus Omnitrophica bacterium]|nr:MBL fold metallo-hydrolase [Candidatus Omnitrophota bacterium]